MCGIMGVVGSEPAVGILLEGLRRLEYRGYDSAGLACVSGGRLELRRAVGKLANLEQVLKDKPVQATVGLGHTRWATHGKPSEANAHPHTDCSGRLAVIHNGIVENYRSLREELSACGHQFKSETDTEVLAHLIEEFLKGAASLEAAVRQALARVEGTYGLGVVSADEPGRLVAARRGSPLVLGLGQGAQYLASDVPALLSHTRDVVFLEDGDLAVLERSGVRITRPDGARVERASVRIQWDPVQAEKAGYKHFMLKEIFEQPRVIEDTLRGRILEAESDVFLEALELSDAEAKALRRVALVACGTSWHAALVGKFFIEAFAGLNVEVDIGSEFRYRDPLVGPGDLVVVISQSGETADTLAALREAKARGARTASICNVLGSSITREAQGTLYTHAGPEIGVASTKAFTAQLTALYLLAVYLGRRRGSLGAERAGQLLEALRKVPRQVEAILRQDAAILAIAKSYSHHRDFLYLGRGLNYPIALEGALKLKEISYIHAEGYPAGEMKHGPIALIDEDLPVVALVPQGRHYDKVMSNVEEARAREGKILVVATEGDLAAAQKAEAVMSIPACAEETSPLLTIIPLQLLAYHIAVRRGCDVDQPRNLAKSVTVE
jgi:glucosamine--fructose-6-phosphate aminotransferase (isomerizing)